MARYRKGFSVISCTKRKNFLNNLFNNYYRQRYPKKELIIIINKDNISIGPYKKKLKKYTHVHIYRLPEKVSLGKCLNYAVKKTKLSYIAKFDDDDYYAPNYLSENKQTFDRINADIIGKRAHFMYLQRSKILILRSHKNENQYVSALPGATLVIKRKVFRKVQFPNRSIGEDTDFCRNSKAKGYKIYSAGRYNFAAIRRKNLKSHTWVISDERILASPIINYRHVRNYKQFVQKGTHK
ncbi:glycosyltransferase [Paenibacillus sp. IHBB 10380]|uniref:glycosyltransferase n=1 Tax=Paenibacillus sp. IHBB 10380 TaxID=1566358 RepID=UPI0005D866C2|nr:glycosyltransferase [Paenibacillus sp. IHBB 10380]AJS60434.1 glycosyl transferase family 2 [Paenibacillus sp. IHBB 10380]